MTRTRTAILIVAAGLAVALLAWQVAADRRPIHNILINKNTIPNPADPMPGQAITIIGPDDDGRVDHVRLTMYGFSVDPLFSCDFANGVAAKPTIVQNRESLCTFQARGCTLEEGCQPGSGIGYGPSTFQLRALSTQDWTSNGRGTRVQMSTTRNDTTLESAKWNLSDGGHMEYGGSLPVLGAGCGDGATVEGSDNGFRVVIGSQPSPRCVVAFNNPWLLPYARTAYAPMCVVNNDTSTAMIRATDVQSSSLTLSGAMRANDRLSVVCVGRHDLP